MISANESMAQGAADGEANDKNAAADDPPHHLNDDARSKWRETWPWLDHNRFDASRDREALAEYCDAWADIRQAESEIQRLAQIATTTTVTGMPGRDSNKTGWLYDQRAAAMERFERAAEKLGLLLDAPSSRPWADTVGILKLFPKELAELDEKDTDSASTGRQRIWTRKRVWDALQRSHGNMAAAARLLSESYGVTCARSTISYLVKKHPQLREAIEECEEVLLETCDVALAKSAIAGDAESQMFLLCKYDPRFQGQA